MKPLKQILFQRLVTKGIDINVLPGFIRSLAYFFSVNPQASLREVNERLNYLGWIGFELDYHTWQLAIAWFEAEGLSVQENCPAG